jgi:hypothetical protein
MFSMRMPTDPTNTSWSVKENAETVLGDIIDGSETF